MPRCARRGGSIYLSYVCLIGLGLFVPSLCSAEVLQKIRPQLKDQVTIYRDLYGVPHIIGETEQATFFGYGYAQAQDHLEAMMLQYRDAQGRRAEILGDQAFGSDYLRYKPHDYRWDGDYLERLLRTWQTVEENKCKIDPAVYNILDAFAQGVNYFIAEHRARIPVWIDHVSAEDIEALERSNYMRFYSINSALVKLAGGSTQALPNFGSNQWAIAPWKSENGRVIHVENVHMPWANRFQNYEAHLVTPGQLNVAGISWFSSPFFLSGFNEHITWSVSWNQPNIADVYEETVRGPKPLRYLYDGTWKDIRVDYATFHIKNPDGTIRTETRPLYYTHHGPIVKIDQDRNGAYAVRLPNFDGVNYSSGLYYLMKATDVYGFKAALARQPIPLWNFLCTDANNIYWVHNGIVALRNEGYGWYKPVPGWDKQTEWGPSLPFAANPQLLNPPSGFLQNCNNPPWMATRDSGLKPLDPAPYYLSCPVSADAGEEVLNNREKGS
jgi:acyl-homoserine-lactone acylase